IAVPWWNECTSRNAPRSGWSYGLTGSSIEIQGGPLASVRAAKTRARVRVSMATCRFGLPVGCRARAEGLWRRRLERWSLGVEGDTTLEAARGHLRPTPLCPGREPQHAPPCRRGRQAVRDGPADGDQVEVGHGRGGHPQRDRAPLALPLDHAPAPQLAADPDIARPSFEPRAPDCP